MFEPTAGAFKAETSGMTHLSDSGGVSQVSAYRMFTTSPIFFDSGVRLQWRNGDVTDPATGACSAMRAPRCCITPKGSAA